MEKGGGWVPPIVVVCSGARHFLGVEIGHLVFLEVFLGKNKVFKMPGIFRGNPGTDLDPCLDVIPYRMFKK